MMTNAVARRRDVTDFDVVVVGGGSAGVAAAVAAARTGARTVLVERAACLGGAATLRNVVTYCGLHERTTGKQVVAGVAGEVLDRLRALGAVSEPTRFTGVSVVFDPESVKVVLDDLCREAEVVVRLHTMLIGAESTGDAVWRVSLADHSGTQVLTGSAFVDATGDADLATLAGAAVRYGTGGSAQNGTLGARFGGIPIGMHIDRELLGTAVRRARAEGATDLVQDSGLVARMPVSGDVIAYVVDAEYDVRDALQTSQAESAARRASRRYLEVIRSIPGCEAAYLVNTGPELGTRESRHMVAPRVLTEDELLTACPIDDAVAVGAWPMEFHPGAGRPVEWRFIGGPGYYGIPLDCLRSIDRSNLFAAGRAMDGDRGAGASLRAMGTAFATGQAAGILAALTAAGGEDDAASVRAVLRTQGAALPLEFDHVGVVAS